MGVNDHNTGSINNSLVGIGGDIIKQLCDGLICVFCGGCLLRADFTKGDKEFFLLHVFSIGELQQFLGRV